MKTLYVTDLDGTLLNPRAQISPGTLEIITQLIRQGVWFTYATARSIASAGKITSALPLTLPVVTFNGSFLMDPRSGEQLEACMLDRQKIEPIVQAIRQNALTPLIYAFIDGRERVSWLAGRENGGIRNYLRDRPGDARLRGVDSYEQLFAGDIFHIVFIGNLDGEAELLRPVLAGIPHVTWGVQEDTYNKGEFWLEIYRHDATKAHGVRKLIERLGPDRVVCFGDNLNDLPMFRIADEAYAVENAVPELRAAATGIIAANDQDGVARWIWEDVHHKGQE